MTDLFISYSSFDREAVRRIVEAFEREGVSVWWDQLITEGEWGPQIEKALSESRRVVAFISKNVALAERYYVFVEMQRAQNAKKLIPVKIGEFTLPIMIEGLIVGEQLVFVSDFEGFWNGPHFQRICSLLKGAQERKDVDSAPCQWGWLETDPSIEKLSLSLAVAVFEGSPLGNVLDFSKKLERRLNAEVASNAPEQPEKNVVKLLSPRTNKLASIGALLYAEKHARLGVDIECVRFADPQRSYEVLARVWDQYDDVHPHVRDWLGGLTHAAPYDARQRMGLMIGRILRTHFASVHEALILPWIRDGNDATRDVADMALAVSVLDSTLGEAVEKIVDSFADSSDAKILRAAVELACGYTGSQIRGLATRTLKKVAESKHGDFKLLRAMEESIANMVQRSLESDDNSLLNLGLLITDLSEWARYQDEHNAQRLPIYLFLRLMYRLPVRAPGNVPGLMSLEALTLNSEPHRATANVFCVALRDAGDEEFSPRALATEILNRWLDAVADGGGSDALLALAREIYANAAADRDRDRLAFILRRRYDRDQLAIGNIKVITISGAVP